MGGSARQCEETRKRIIAEEVGWGGEGDIFMRRGNCNCR